MNKKGVTILVGTMLFLLVLVVFFFVFRSWFYNVAQERFADVSVQISDSDVEILGADTSSIYVKSYIGRDLQVKNIFVDGVSCGVSGVLFGMRISNISVGTCFDGKDYNGGVYVSVSTDSGMISDTIVFNRD
ncbi:MAG: hypothetical protein ACOCXG_05755 [Nanoarchaeota archaeon]